MSCICAKPTDEFHGWRCSITGDACVFWLPNQKACHQMIGDVCAPNDDGADMHRCDDGDDLAIVLDDDDPILPPDDIDYDDSWFIEDDMSQL